MARLIDCSVTGKVGGLHIMETSVVIPVSDANKNITVTTNNIVEIGRACNTAHVLYRNGTIYVSVVLETYASDIVHGYNCVKLLSRALERYSLKDRLPEGASDYYELLIRYCLVNSYKNEIMVFPFDVGANRAEECVANVTRSMLNLKDGGPVYVHGLIFDLYRDSITHAYERFSTVMAACEFCVREHHIHTWLKTCKVKGDIYRSLARAATDVSAQDIFDLELKIDTLMS